MNKLDKDQWLEKAKGVLVQEGFQHTPLQGIKSGQGFGLVRKAGDIWEMHVRGFDDGRLESEIEVSRDYLEHLNDKYRRDATPELKQILDFYQIPYMIEGDINHSTIVLPYPETVTPWKPIVALTGLVVFLIWLGVKESKGVKELGT